MMRPIALTAQSMRANKQRCEDLLCFVGLRIQGLNKLGLRMRSKTGLWLWNFFVSICCLSPSCGRAIVWCTTNSEGWGRRTNECERRWMKVEWRWNDERTMMNNEWTVDKLSSVMGRDDSWPATVFSVVPSYSHADSNLIGSAQLGFLWPGFFLPRGRHASLWTLLASRTCHFQSFVVTA